MTNVIKTTAAIPTKLSTMIDIQVLFARFPKCAPQIQDGARPPSWKR